MAEFKTHQEELEYLQKLGFPTNPLNQSAAGLREIWQIAENLNSKRDKLNYPIDGLVIKLNDLELVEKLGVVGKTPRGWAAVKFAADEVTTKILGVTWQVGRTGKVTPVAELEAVELAGTKVKRATLHNFKEFSEKALQKNDILVIRKAGDIIPEVVQVLYNYREKKAEVAENLHQSEHNSVFVAPESCPKCGQNLGKTETDVDLVCLNSQGCPAQILGRLTYYTQRSIANITGLSEKNLQKFIEKFNISDIPDLYNLPFEQIRKMEGFGQKSVENLQKSVEHARTIQDYKFLAGLGIDGIGPEVAKLICELVE